MINVEKLRINDGFGCVQFCSMSGRCGEDFTVSMQLYIKESHQETPAETHVNFMSLALTVSQYTATESFTS